MNISAIMLLLQGESFGWRTFVMVGIGCIVLIVLLKELATVLIAIYLLSMTPPLARGQDSATTATLAGSVRDAAGAIVPGASIMLRNMATNQTRSVTSEADGSYAQDSGFTFGGLRPRSNSISIDGLDNTDETTGATKQRQQ